MSDAPERIGLIGDGLGRWALATRDESDIAIHYILTTASPEVFAALEPVQALIAGAYEAMNCGCKQDKSDCLSASGNVPFCYRDGLCDTPSEALAALAAREAAAERRGWLAGMGWAAKRLRAIRDTSGPIGKDDQYGMGAAWAMDSASAAIRAEMEKGA